MWLRKIDLYRVARRTSEVVRYYKYQAAAGLFFGPIEGKTLWSNKFTLKISKPIIQRYISAFILVSIFISKKHLA